MTDPDQPTEGSAAPTPEVEGAAGSEADAAPAGEPAAEPAGGAASEGPAAQASAADAPPSGAEPPQSAPAVPRPRPPGPRPGPVPRPPSGARRPVRPGSPGGSTPPGTAPIPAPPEDDPALIAEARTWGRVDEAGTVFVRSGDGERSVGQMPDATADEALMFFVRRYVDLRFEVDLLEQRVSAGTASPDEAAASLKQVRGAVRHAQAVGDLAGLEARLDTLGETLSARRAARREERARVQAVAQADKERVVAEAERLAEGDDWRHGANRLRQLLDRWKALPRLERSADDALWRRFSSARTTYTRRRKSHFAEVGEQRETARAAKERLVTQAEELSTSTQWGPTAGAYRDLMRRWKAAGPAAKDVDDRLWGRFRAAQDTFFGARDAANAEVDREFEANAETKRALLVEAEALLPVRDVRAAKESFRRLAERWDAAGKVPREQIKSLEGRFSAVEKAIRGTEDDRWRRSNPEARARAADTVAQLESSLADLGAKRAGAEAAGDTKRAAEHAASMEAREAWLAEARRALDEFSS